MFKLQPNPTFTAAVAIPGPAGEAGTLEIEFRHKGRAELKAWFLSMESKPDRTDVEFLSEIIVGWKNCDAEYSPAALATLLDLYPAAPLAIVAAYRVALLEGRAKN